jgi:hypothetical protein
MIDDPSLFLGFYLSCLLGVIGHELAHAYACIFRGGSVPRIALGLISKNVPENEERPKTLSYGSIGRMMRSWTPFTLWSIRISSSTLPF